jgi:cytochrome P450
VTAEVRYDPYDADVQRNPYPVYRALRDHAPAFHDDARDFWALSRFDDVISALHDPETYCSGQGIILEGTARSPYPMIIALDPPRHTDLRKLVSRAFGTKPTAAYEPQIRALTRSLIAQFSTAGSVDLVDALSVPLPLLVIGDMLGVPGDERAWFRHQTEQLMAQRPDVPESVEAARAAGGALFARFTDLIEERRAHPGDDLVSHLIDAEVDGEHLDPGEILGFCYLLILAGHETTMNLISNGAVALAQHPEQREVLRLEPARIPDAVEEVLRWESPVQSQARTTTRDVEIHGRVIPEGKKVLMLFASAGRDERVFDDPDRFDITRTFERHLSFGHGIHFCLGAALARLEARIAFEELLLTIPDWEPTVPPGQLERTSGYMIRGPATLPLEFTPANSLTS